MHAYIAARIEAEAHLQASSVSHTVLRPWYVLGPGHPWPRVLEVPDIRERGRACGDATFGDALTSHS